MKKKREELTLNPRTGFSHPSDIKEFSKIPVCSDSRRRLNYPYLFRSKAKWEVRCFNGTDTTIICTCLDHFEASNIVVLLRLQYKEILDLCNKARY